MEYVLKQIRINFEIVRKVFSFLNKNAQTMLYNSLIKSCLTYCIFCGYFENATIIHKV